MRYAVDIVPVDFARAEVVEVTIEGFRRVLGATLVEKKNAILMANKQPRPMCGLVVEYDPKGPKETHRFVAIMGGTCLETKDDSRPLENVALIIVPGQPPVAIYREVPAFTMPLIAAS